MSQLYELWKKLKHKLADRQFLLSLLPALLIALYLAGLLIHAAYNGVRIMFSANTSAEPIWNWNPFVAISSVFSPFGIFLIAFVYGMVFLFSGRARELLTGEKTDKDQRGFEILHDGLHGTSGWMTKEEQTHTLQVGKAESLSGTLIGKMDAEGSDRIAAVSDQLYMSGHVIVYDQESTGERFRSLSNQMNRVLHKAKQLEDLHRILNDSISAAAHSRAQTVHQAAEAAGQHTQGLKTLLDAWGTEPGSEQFGEMDMEILDKAQSSDLLARIARYLGPCRELMHEQRNNGYTYRRGEKCGITLGSQIQQALSSELAYLAHPVTAPLFLHKISRRQVRQYKRRERISLGAGDVIVCVDESGSTEFDDKDAWAKAIAYALVDKVGSQGRCASVIHFSSASEVSEDLFIPGQYTSEDVMNSARHFYCGGTNYEAPLRKAVSTLDSGVLSKADIVFITDGQCSISSVFQDWLCAKLSEHHASITGVLLDSGNNFEFSLKGFCKTIYRTSELAPSEILSELVLS